VESATVPAGNVKNPQKTIPKATMIGVLVVAVGALISCVGALNGWILLQGQVPMSAAKDKLLPDFLNEKNNDGVSKKALIFSSVIISLLVIANYSEGLVWCHFIHLQSYYRL